MKKNPMPSLSSWKEVMIQISPFHDSSSFSLFSAKQHCVCHVFDDDHPLSTAHDFQGSASLLLLFMCALWSALKTVRRLLDGASIHGKSCCNLLQRLMGVDCARGLWLVAGFNESHDSRVRKEQHFRKKKLFYDNANGLVISIFMRSLFLGKFEYHFTRRETIEFLDTGNDGKNSICLLWNSLNGFQTVIHEVRWWWPP